MGASNEAAPWVWWFLYCFCFGFLCLVVFIPELTNNSCHFFQSQNSVAWQCS